MNTKTKLALPIVFSVVGSIGVGLTTYLGITNTPKATERIKKLKEVKPDCTKIDILKTILPTYSTTLLCGGATVASIVASTIISRKAEASLTATAIMLDQGYRKYKDKIKEKLGLDKHNDILESISKDEVKNVEKTDSSKHLYYLEPVGFFEAEPEKLAYALDDINQRIHMIDFRNSYKCAMIYDFLKFANARLIDKDKVTNESLIYGWSYEWLSDKYEREPWVHMHLKDINENGKEYTLVTFEEDMIFDPGNHGAIFADYDKDDNSTELEIYEYSPSIVYENKGDKNEK